MGVTVKYKGNPIIEMEETDTKTLKTGGMYCEDDITIEHVVTAAGDPNLKKWDIAVSSGKPSSGAILTLLTDEWLAANRTNAKLKVVVAPKFTPTEVNKQIFFYNGNSPYYTLNSTNYYSTMMMTGAAGVLGRWRTRSLTAGVEDVGDIDITSTGALRIVAYDPYLMGVGDYTVTAWID